MNNHQSLKAEIDAREENFSICINLGRDLLDRKHYRSDEVRLLLGLERSRALILDMPNDINVLRHEKTGFLHMRKQRRRSAVQ